MAKDTLLPTVVYCASPECKCGHCSLFIAHATDTPKFHLAEHHTVTWMQRCGVSLGLLGEQGGEGIHSRFNTRRASLDDMPRDWRIKVFLSHRPGSLSPDCKPHVTRKLCIQNLFFFSWRHLCIYNSLQNACAVARSNWKPWNHALFSYMARLVQRVPLTSAISLYYPLLWARPFFHDCPYN